MRGRFEGLGQGTGGAQRAHMLTALLLAASSTDPDATLCLDDDVRACVRLAERVLSEDTADARAEAMTWLERACELDSADACGRMAELIGERNPERAEELRQRAERLAADRPEPVTVQPATLAEAPPMVEAPWSEIPREARGERWGLMGTAGVLGSTSATGAGAVFLGAGARVGLVERFDEARFVPAVGVMVGADLWDRGMRPWLEARLELMSAPPGGLLRSQAEMFLSLGAMWLFDSATVVRPYVAFGGGLNWFRDLETMFQKAMKTMLRSFGGVLGLPFYWVSSPVWLAFMLAGRFQLRVTVPLGQRETAQVAAMIGIGF